MQTIDNGMVFAAGLGSRLKPLTDNTPKPLVKVCGKPLFDFAAETLHQLNVKNIIANTFYLPEKMESYLDKNFKDVKYIREDIRLETGGGLINASHLIDQDFCYTINADIILQGNVKNIFDTKLHDFFSGKYNSILVLTDIKNTLGYEGNGDFYLENGLLKKDPEKNNLVFTGLQLINIHEVKKINKKIFSLSEFFKEQLAANKLGYVIFNGKMLHIGDMNGHKLAENYFTNG